MWRCSFPNGWKRLAAESKECPMNSQELACRPVIDEARVLDFLHEEANARPRGSYHFCQRLMTDFRNCCLACSTPIKMGHSEEDMGQSFLAGITALVNQSLLISDVPGQDIGPEHVCQLYLPFQGEHHGLLLNSQKAAVRNA